MSLRLLLLALAGLVAIGLLRSQGAREDALNSLPGAGDPNRVLMVSAEWCGYCQRQLADFRAAGVRFTLLDFDQAEGRDAVAALGGRGVPLTVIGDEVIHGYNRPMLAKQLAVLGYTLR